MKKSVIKFDFSLFLNKNGKNKKGRMNDFCVTNPDERASFFFSRRAKRW
jgi:hypothetical protein